MFPSSSCNWELLSLAVEQPADMAIPGDMSFHTNIQVTKMLILKADYNNDQEVLFWMMMKSENVGDSVNVHISSCPLIACTLKQEVLLIVM